MGLKKHGITSETIKNMILGAGVIYKNLKYEKPSNGWTGTPLGATSGGLKFNYEAQWLDVEVDGATVLIKGVSKQKVGESRDRRANAFPAPQIAGRLRESPAPQARTQSGRTRLWAHPF